jgi:hypothetical protein
MTRPAASSHSSWPPDLSDDDLLARLLALNLERAAAQTAAPTTEPVALAEDEDGDE